MEDKPIIAIYDVRGIQDYVFRTNALKEIVGASLIVDNLIINEFKNAVLEQKIEDSAIILNWQNTNELKFENNTSIQIEVLYYGGGNLVVLFRNENLCKNVSIQMAKSIIKNAYGLSLAYAYIEKTNDYQTDWRNLKDKLATVKATTPLNKPTGVIPIVQYDKITGFPLSQTVVENGISKKVTYEAYQKIKKYNNDRSNTRYMKQFDKMRTDKQEGLIAIVHIDGNSMGQNIGEIMKSAKDYKEATNSMREISRNIHKVFEVDAINKVMDNIEKICKEHGVEHLISNKEVPFRPIIGAGDDITFVCNERISLDIVKEYINAIRKGNMYGNEYPFSACAGIAIVHSHYPFYKAYQIAEECCQSAKKRAKNEGLINRKIGNFVDFQYCYSSNIGEFSEHRKENYQNIEGKTLIKRPYGIYSDEEKEAIKNSKEKMSFDLDNFEGNLKFFSNISRNTAKDIRDYYYKSEGNIKTLFTRLKSKDVKIEKEPFDENGVAEYYDALEFLDIYKKKEAKDEQK